MQAGGQRLWVECLDCGAGIVNDTNLLHREGWLETTRGLPRYVRCAECAGCGKVPDVPSADAD